MRVKCQVHISKILNTNILLTITTYKNFFFLNTNLYVKSLLAFSWQAACLLFSINHITFLLKGRLVEGTHERLDKETVIPQLSALALDTCLAKLPGGLVIPMVFCLL